LKEREDLQRNEDLKLKEEDKIELQRIAREIKEEKEKEKARVMFYCIYIYRTFDENKKISYYI